MTTNTSAAAAAIGAMVPTFQGSDDWMRAQLQRHALKAKQRELRDADPTIIAPFNRAEFTTRVDVSTCYSTLTQHMDRMVY